MTLQEFQQHLCENGGYETAAVPERSAADRLFGRYNGWFYLKLVFIVFSASTAALRRRYTRTRFASDAFHILRLVELCGGRVRIEGIRHVLAEKRPVVFAGNHMSTLETMTLQCMTLLAGPVSHVVKESLVRYPVFGRVLRATAAITVTRQDPRRDLRDVLEKGVAALKSGSSVMIFPQATRSTGFDPATFGSLAVKLADRAGARVLPVAVKTDFMGVGRRVKEFGPLDRTRTVHFRFGPAIEVAGRKREAHRECLRFVSESLREWGVKLESVVSDQ